MSSANRCCPHPVERHAYNGCADCGCNVRWTEHPERDKDMTASAVEARAYHCCEDCRRRIVAKIVAKALVEAQDLVLACRSTHVQTTQRPVLGVLAAVVRAQVAKFSDSRLNDGDDIWHARELEYRGTVATMANEICAAFGFDVASFASACGLYVSDGRDTYSDCRPGELSWESPRS